MIGDRTSAEGEVTSELVANTRNERENPMKDEQRRPMIRLVERKGDEPSHVVVHKDRLDVLRLGLDWLKRGVLASARRLADVAGMSAAPDENDLPTYTPRRDKIVEAVLILLHRATTEKPAFSNEALLATMFLADKGHLDAHGRPIFFDNYVAEAHGPAGSALLEMLDQDFQWAAFGFDKAAWTCAEDGAPFASREPNLRRISASDVEALNEAAGIVAALNAAQLSHFTKRNDAYASAWSDGGGSGRRLDPRLIPDHRDDELIDELVYASRHAFIAEPRR